jgi:hypothetical protein
MLRDRTTLLFVPLALALGLAVSCAESEPTNPNQTGAAGTGAAGNSTGAAGNATGAAGNATGAAGNATGAAGNATGAAGNATGAAGSTTGAAGSTTGAAGSTTGAAGSTTGAAGSTTGAAGQGVAGQGAAGQGAAGTGGPALSYATDIEPILVNKCKACHTTNTAGMLSLKMGSGFASLVTNGAAKTDLNCKLLDAANKKRVIAGDPDHSYLWIKINNTNAMLMAQMCGEAMPENNANGGVTAAEKMKIRDWIMGGAKP